jgi:hypothetical protein
MLMASAARDEEALWPKVKAKTLTRVVWAEERLRQRANVEAAEMTRILLAQQTAIARELAKREKEHAAAQQVSLPWLPDEHDQKDQYDADTKHMTTRRVALERELREEPDRIKALYDVKHYRLERVGLVYLWPATA